MSTFRYLCAGLLALGLPRAASGQQSAADPLALDSLLNTPISASAKYQQTARQAASSVTIVTHEQIEQFGYRSLEDVLAGVSGFYLSNDRNYSYLGARGFSRPTDYNNRILLLLDGHTVNEGIWGSAPIELPVNLQSLERVEIVRGPGSALYGTGAVFGVINLVTRAGVVSGGTQAELRGGSYGRRGVSGEVGASGPGGIDLALSGLWDGSDGHDLFYPQYDSPATHDGIAHNLDWERRWGVNARARRGELTFSSMITHRVKAIPTGAYGMAFDASPANTVDDYAFAELALDHAVDASKQVRVRGFFDRYAYDGTYAYDTYSYRDVARDESLGGEATFLWDLGSSQHLTVGAEYRRHVRARYSIAYDGTGFDVPFGIASAYVEHEFQPSPRLTLLAGVRADHYSTYGGAVSPRAALLFDPGRGTTIKLLYGNSFRAPNIYETLSQGFGYEPNPDLGNERAMTVELVAQQRLGAALLATASVFNYEDVGLIENSVDSTNGAFVYRNGQNANATGVELSLEARLGRGVLGYANYTHQRAHDKDTRETLTNSPSHIVKAGIAAPVAPWVGGAVEARAESGRLTVLGTSTDGYVLGNLHLWLDPSGRDGDGRMLLSVRLNNVLNARYATPGGFEHLQPAIEQDGRNLSAELRYRF